MHRALLWRPSLATPTMCVPWLLHQEVSTCGPAEDMTTRCLAHASLPSCTYRTMATSSRTPIAHPSHVDTYRTIIPESSNARACESHIHTHTQTHLHTPHSLSPRVGATMGCSSGPWGRRQQSIPHPGPRVCPPPLVPPLVPTCACSL